MKSISFTTPRSLKRLCSGVTLVELMIALTLGLLVVLAAGSFYMSNSQTFSASDNQSRIQENLRFADYIFSQVFNNAGFRTVPQQAEEAAFDSGCPTGANNIKGAISGTSATNNNLGSGDTVTVCYQGVRSTTSGGNNSDGGTINCLGDGVAPLVNAINTLRIVSNANTGLSNLVCSASFSNAPTGTASQDTVLIQNVSAMRIFYGVNSQVVNGATLRDIDNPSADTFLPSSGMTINHWKAVVSVQVYLLLRVNEASTDLPAGPYVLAPNGFTDAQFQYTGAPGMVYQIFKKTYTLRNRIKA